MLSTITSLLPSVFQSGADRSPVQDIQHPVTPPEQHQEGKPEMVDEQGVKRKKERTNESFIVVRPPPSKSNHPLNLQLQLLPPHTRDPTRSSNSRRSVDSSAEADLDLARTRSDVSMASGNGSVTSFSTVATSSSASSGRRMIIPLYNLQAHNVMTNVIVDAGTDARIARFLKRGLEIIGLAVLEPIEVWGVHGRNRHSLIDSAGLSPVHAHALLPPDEFNTPGSSAISLSSENHQELAPPPAAAPVSTPERDRGPKKFFGKLFNKKRGSSPQEPLSPSPFPSPLPASPSVSNPKRQSLQFQFQSPHSPLPSTPSPLAPAVPSSSTSSGAVLQPPVLGIQPTLSSPTYPPRGRATTYIWVVRRWLKGAPDGLLGGVNRMLDGARTAAHIGAPSGTAVQVSLEWTRGHPKSRRRPRTQETDAEEETSRERRHDQPQRRDTQSSHPPPPLPLRRKAGAGASPRRSLESTRSVSVGTTTNSTEEGAGTRRRTSASTSDGEDSDAEDSETPWTCTLIVRKEGEGAVDAGPGPALLRVKVAGVVPTPHHPKVVAMLRIPFPLPDVEIDRVQIRRRVVTAAGVARPVVSPPPSGIPGAGAGSGSGTGTGTGRFGRAFSSPAQEAEGLVLTAEEIKDMVSSTALWLVVREAFGGVGRVSRKGDGWRIRG